MKTLSGDREVEWSWVLSHLPANRTILDVGCTESILFLTMMRLGHNVTGIDIRTPLFKVEGMKFDQVDVMTTTFFDKKFDTIINCSSVEHFGLSGRYGVEEDKLDGDIEAMGNLRTALTPDGIMILTIPLGKDAIYMPNHRVYGPFRIGFLLYGYEIVEEEFWHKNDDDVWIQCDKKTALNEQSEENYYALGLFVLRVKND